MNAPLRLEAEEEPAVAQWEIFAGLKILHKPTELVVIPGGTHSLVRPWHRLTSQGGTVDWFRFWLKGEVDSDPGKADQYTRWREMQGDMKSTPVSPPK